MKNILKVCIAFAFLLPATTFAQTETKNNESDTKPVKIVQKIRKVTGPEAKNNRFENAQVTTESYTVVKKQDLQGPEAKNKRTNLGESEPATMSIAKDPRAKLTGPEAKNYKYWPKKQQ